MTKNTLRFSVHLMSVPNNVKGNNIISNLRKQMKSSKSPARLTLHGRGYRYGKGRRHVRPDGTHDWDNRYQNSLPLSKAEKIAIYLSPRWIG